MQKIGEQARVLFGNAAISDCEALAQLVEWTLQHFSGTYGTDETNVTTFVEDIGLILTERDKWLIKPREEDKDLYLGYPFAGDSGFKKEYRDGSNQVRHFWGFLMAGYHHGMVPVLDFLTYIGEESEADKSLGYKGILTGAVLGGIGLQLKDLPQWIRQHLCEAKSAREVTAEEPH